MAEDTETPLRDAPVAALEDILRSVPRLLERTVHQAELVRAAAAHLPCIGQVLTRRLEPSDPGTVTPEQLGVLDLFADGTDAESDADALTAPATSNGTTPVETVAAEQRLQAPPATAPSTADATPDGPMPLESELAVPDYDSLAASQVVPRLAMLSLEDLRAVLAYEQGHRHRQTILNRVSQLLEA